MKDCFNNEFKVERSGLNLKTQTQTHKNQTHTQTQTHIYPPQ